MKKYYSIATIITMMVFAGSFSSCSGNPDEEVGEEYVKKIWIEPFHDNNGSIDQVKSFMSSSMPSYQFLSESNTSNLQLVYSNDNGKEGVIYSFSRLDSLLYSVIDTELIINKEVVLEYLNDHYSMVSGSSNTSLIQYVFTNEDISLAISTSKISDDCFNVNYTFIIE